MKKYKMHIGYFGITALFCFGSICALLTGNFVSFLKDLATSSKDVSPIKEILDRKDFTQFTFVGETEIPLSEKVKQAFLK